MNAETMKILKENQQRVNEVLAKMVPMDDQAWLRFADSTDY